MIDTAKEGDGDRNLSNQKMLIPIFRSVNCYSKYALEMFIAVAQVEILSAPRLSEQIKWSYYVNWAGGQGKNMEEDLAQEICNKMGKTMVRKMGANNTLSSISKICRATGGIKLIQENFDNTCNIHETSHSHTTRSSLKDQLAMINELIALGIFTHHAGRHHSPFQI